MKGIPHVKGPISRQAHVQIPDGVVEEEYGRNGFFGAYAHFYRTETPVSWTRIEGNCRPQSFQLFQSLPKNADDFLDNRKEILYNDDVRICQSFITSEMKYFFRNADGDDVLFIHQGAGEIETEFGPFQYKKGDYICIPRGCIYRLIPSSPTRSLIIESLSEVTFPEKGMLGQHALFDPAVIHVPEPQSPPSKLQGLKEFEIKVKRNREITTIFYPHNPLNVVAWKGTLSAWQLNVADIRPVTSERYHLPPSAHTTFIARNFIVCSFLPRPLETGDPTALKVPFF